MAMMKNLTHSAIVVKLFLTALITILTIKAVVAGINPNNNIAFFHDSILVTIAQSSKTHKIRLYPNVTNEVLFFTADGQDGKVYQLFVYNMDGKIAKQTQVRNKETTLLAKFEKGNYLFEVFSNDEKIENGSISIK
jgi:hypothetical protein